MDIVTHLPALRDWRTGQTRLGRPVGFVPTMGALHEGHASLVRAAARDAAKENGAVAVSIFVNPTQFGPNEDLSRYPRTLEADLELCRVNGATLVYTPGTTEIYPPGFDTWVDVGKVGTHWCGASRPGHFRGVSTVVAKLFLRVQPDQVYFGQKDAQQAAMLAKMTRELDFPIRFHVEPTVREPDGLAMSSRNRYLSPSDRAQAVGLFQALKAGEALVRSGQSECALIHEAMTRVLAQMAPDARLDYLGFAGLPDFEPLVQVRFPCHLLGAIRLGNTRLIDNLFLEGA